MKHNISKLVFCIFISMGMVGCTSSSDSSSLVGSITDAVKDIINPDPSVNAAEKQVSEIQKELNKNNTYALTEDDVVFLKAEGLQVNENEIKAWVK